jgi:hypothetical protein
MMNDEQRFYLTTKIGKDVRVYSSEAFAITELEFIHLIRMLYVQQRNKALGNKFLKVYRDATEHRKKQREENLNHIGIKEDGEPEKIKRFEER